MRSLQPPDILWIHWRVYNSIANTSKGVLFCPLLMFMSEAFSIPLYFNKTLLHTHTQKKRSTTVNKANRCDGIPVGLFKTLKNDAIKVLYSIYQQICKTQQWPQVWKRSILIPIPKVSTKECSNHRTIALISQASKNKTTSVQSYMTLQLHGL